MVPVSFDAGKSLTTGLYEALQWMLPWRRGVWKLLYDTGPAGATLHCSGVRTNVLSVLLVQATLSLLFATPKGVFMLATPTLHGAPLMGSSRRA
jgi:hypothetical protein